MSVLNYKQLKTYLQDLKVEQVAPVYLIYGDELLYKKALEDVLNRIISDSPGASKDFNYEPIDGANENIPEAVERINTFSLLLGKKIVAICDSKVFYRKEDKEKFLEKAQEAYDKDEIQKTARHLLSYLAFSNLSFDDLREVYRDKIAAVDLLYSQAGQWLDKIVDYCRDHGMTIPSMMDTGEVLEKAIENGFPGDNHLIITTDLVDKRRRLYNTIDKHGIIIDCSVPKGDRTADKKAQEAVLYEEMGRILSKNNKTMARDAYQALVEMTGFDLRTFSNNLEKLISYAGDRKKITVEDIEAVLHRTKKDPVYDLTGSILDKNIHGALFFLDSLLTAGFHPLQILTAMANLFRRMIQLKDFTDSDQGRRWHSGCDYGYFKREVFPGVENYDRLFIKALERWETGEPVKKKPITDLLIAKTPKSPYPVYMMLKQSENFTKKELIHALESLSEADLRLKSTGQNPKLILEGAVFKILRKL